ncbi:hypothetical protein [Caenimonas aquaedulcis]|uniref:Uncharacterized protein n=1 Tax=Caenimonas aquaedulcis TaxID=2793270 RepID=A0A931H920_9BURK|nr:hypothetical protein [Caenimonas aquaedulcis]MBG9390578.1 hypothetical protein [Caenimonas aquaedulcis]
MFVEVRVLYREGIAVRDVRPVVGQIFSDRHKGVQVLYLRAVDWVHHESTPSEPLSILWHPVCVVVNYSSMCFRGVEAVQKGPARRWTTQKWLCDVLDAQRAKARLAQQQQESPRVN